MASTEYDLYYSRNIGLFTREQQDRIKELKVFVAGCGGAGGIQAAALARFGIRELRLMDPGSFDEPDFNRQYSATRSNLGRNKAESTAEQLREINPFMSVTAYPDIINNDDGLEEAMRGCGLVIDAIDYAGFDYKVKFARAARRLGLYNFTSPLPGFGALLIVFDPQGTTLEEFYDSPPDTEAQKAFRIPPGRFFGRRPLSPTWKEYTEGSCPYISTNSGAAALSGGLLATEAILWHTGIRSAHDLVVAPRVILVDFLSHSTEIYDPLAELAEIRGNQG